MCVGVCLFGFRGWAWAVFRVVKLLFVVENLCLLVSFFRGWLLTLFLFVVLRLFAGFLRDWLLTLFGLFVGLLDMPNVRACARVFRWPLKFRWLSYNPTTLDHYHFPPLPPTTVFLRLCVLELALSGPQFLTAWTVVARHRSPSLHESERQISLAILSMMLEHWLFCVS